MLTAGDEVDLPVALRNYTKQSQRVTTTVQTADAIVSSSPARHETETPAGGSVNLSVPLRARAVADQASIRVTSLAGEAADAIQKSVRVHPDGQEESHVFAGVIAGRDEFRFTVPASAIAGATRADLHVHSGLSSLLAESAAAILRVPRGCGEQVTSAGYANLVAMRVLPSGPRRDEAERHVRDAIRQLRDLHKDGGGIPYWRSGSADAGLSAYVLEFLTDASAQFPEAREVAAPIAAWLGKVQQGNGAWKLEYPGHDQHIMLLTAFVAEALMRAGENAAVPKAARFLARASGAPGPHLLASMIRVDPSGKTTPMLVRSLTEMGKPERGALYWDTPTNLPLHGWGAAGRVETTAHVVRTLSAWRATHPDTTDLDSVIRRGALFLLRARDRAGYWLSTQATLRAMVALTDGALGLDLTKPATVEVSVNGQSVGKLVTSPSSDVPGVVDISKWLRAGDNHVELTASGVAVASLGVTHWNPWTASAARTSPDLRFSATFAKTTAAVGEPVQCHVKAERVGSRGYGMMIAEAGLPPGVEADRASLERVVDKVAGVNRYEVWPDRVIFYLWPAAGGVEFDFLVRPRMPIRAKSARSALYDYYNPEAMVESPPVSWVVATPSAGQSRPSSRR